MGKTLGDPGPSMEGWTTDKMFSGQCFAILVMFSCRETYISLKINIDNIQPTCIHQLRVSRGPHDLCLGFSIVDLV